MASKRDIERDSNMKHLEFPRLGHTHLEKECCDALQTWTHIDSKSWFPKGNTNIIEGIETKRERMIENENLKHT